MIKKIVVWLVLIIALTFTIINLIEVVNYLQLLYKYWNLPHLGFSIHDSEDYYKYLNMFVVYLINIVAFISVGIIVFFFKDKGTTIEEIRQSIEKSKSNKKLKKEIKMQNQLKKLQNKIKELKED